MQAGISGSIPDGLRPRFDSRSVSMQPVLHNWFIKTAVASLVDLSCLKRDVK